MQNDDVSEILQVRVILETWSYGDDGMGDNECWEQHVSQSQSKLETYPNH